MKKLYSKMNLEYLKLFVAGMILIWLFMVSPFNPVNSELEKSDYEFVRINFLYWSFVTVFLFWIIFFVSKNNFERLSPYISAGIYGFFITFFIFYGLDVLDSGFSLSKQWSMYNGMWKENFDFFAGTNLIGGLWLKIIGEPNLLGSRLGFIIVQVLTIFFSYKIMLLYFSPDKLFPVYTVLAVFLSIWHLYFTINYDNLPYLFFAISNYFLLKGIQKEALDKKYFILAGSFIALSAFCKITYYPAFILPIFIIMTDRYINKTVRVPDRILYVIFGGIITLGIIFIFMYFVEGLNNYISHFINIIYELAGSKDPSKIHAHDHSTYFLLDIYRANLMVIAENIYKYFVLIIAFEYSIFRTKKTYSLRALLMFSGYFALYYFVFEKNQRNLFTDNNFVYLLSFYISIILIVAFFSKESIKKFVPLILASAGLFFFSFLGSDLGFRPAFHTGSGLIFFSASIILFKQSELSFFRYKFKPVFIFYFIIISFSLNAVFKKDNLYREMEFKYLYKAFETNSLAGIKSNPAKVEAVDSLLIYLKTRPDLKNKKIIFTHSNPMMYYITGTNYPLETPWDVLNNYYDFENDLVRIMPDFIVIPKNSHRVMEWPVRNEPEGGGQVFEKYYKLYQKFIEEYNYSVAYKNSFYTVYITNTINTEKKYVQE